MTRGLVDRVRRFDRNTARLLVHEFAVRELLPDDGWFVAGATLTKHAPQATADAQPVREASRR